MSYLSLYRKWRPGTFAQLLGQAHVTETLASALRDGRISHAYLFAGPRGTGKTSTARILAKALNCERGVTPTPCGECGSCVQIADGSSLDVFEMDAASHTSVDDVREIRERIPFAAVAGGHKVYIIDEAHQLSGPAFNALLKMLEEPPAHVVFVLCTTEAHKLPATVVSRCQRFEFRRVPSRMLAEHLSNVAKSESFDAEDAALRVVARHAHGSVRDALSLLDQLAGTQEGPVTEAGVLELVGEAPEDVLLGLASAVGSGDVLAAFRLVDRVVERGWDPRQLLRQLIDELRDLFLVRRGAEDLVDVDDDYRPRLRELAETFTGAHLEWALRVLGDTQADVRWSSHPRLTLEVAIARAARLEADDVQALRARVERLERILLSHPGPAAPAPKAPTRREAAPATESPKKREEAPAPASVDASPTTAAPTAPAPASVDASPTIAAPTAPAPTAPAPASAPAPDGPLDDRWVAFLEAVRVRKRTTHALLKEAWPVEIDGSILLVGFEKSFHAEAVQRPDHLPHLSAALQEAFGQKLRLRCEVMPGERPGRSGAEPASDSPVDLVVRGLGAEIVEEVDG